MIKIIIPDLGFVQAVVNLKSNVIILNRENLLNALDYTKLPPREQEEVAKLIGKLIHHNGWFVLDANVVDWVQIEEEQV